MKQYLRPVATVMLSIISIFILLGVVEFIWLSLYTRPTDTHQLKDMHIGALLVPYVGLLITTFLSGILAIYVAKSRPNLHVGIVGGVVLALTGLNQIGIPHPFWYTVLTFVSIPLMCVMIIKLVTLMNVRTS